MDWIKKQIRSLYKRRLRWFPHHSFSEGRPVVQAWKAGLLDWVNGSPVPVQGLQMYLDLPDSLGLRRSEVYEPLETAMLPKVLRPGMRAVDLGANIGYFTLLIARAVGPAGTVWAFEPDPDNFALLERNLALNGVCNVTALQLAAGDEETMVNLYRSTSNRGDNRIYDDGTDRPVCCVACRPVDAVIEEIPVDFIKMDIQGAEARAVSGMRELLRRSPNVVLLTEYWPDGLKQAGSQPEALLQELESAGLSAYQLEAEDGKPCLHPVTREALTRDSFKGFINLVWTRQPLTL